MAARCTSREYSDKTMKMEVSQKYIRINDALDNQVIHPY
jgi:hypothetical protein